MKISVINPPKVFNPYETFLQIGTPSQCPGGNWPNPCDLTICRELSNGGHNVDYVDGDNKLMEFSEVIEKTLDFSPDFVVMNSETFDYARTPLSSYENVNMLVDGIKLGNPKIKAILYGYHPLVDTRGISTNFDVVVAGEGEGIVSKIVNGKKGGFFIHFVENLDKLELPDYRFVEDVLTECSTFAAPGLTGKFAQVIGSRGCSRRCVFCFRGGTGDRVRFMSPQRVYNELKMLHDQGCDSIYFIDDSWGIDSRWGEKVCEKVKDLGMKFACQSRPDIMKNEKLVKEMGKAGFVNVGMGIETYSDSVLRKIHKGGSTEDIDKAMDVLYNNGMSVIPFLMIGLPGHTMEDIDKTEEFLQKNEDKIAGAGGFLTVPYPMTPMWKEITGQVGGDVMMALDMAGLRLNSLGLGDAVEARELWYKLDRHWGRGADVLSQVKKHRPNIYSRWVEYVKLHDLEERFGL